jgi:cysteine synthase B
MEYARDLAEQMQREGKGRVLDQFANADNPRIHYETTGPEIWADTAGGHPLRQRHGHHRHHHRRVALPEGAEPGGAHRRRAAVARARASPASASGPRPTCPRSTTRPRWTNWCYVSQADAEDMARRLAREEGLFAGISAAGACWVALQLAQQVENATIVFIVCDRGDRYLSTGVFPA